jgi:Uma2 family endonuclease
LLLGGRRGRVDSLAMTAPALARLADVAAVPADGARYEIVDGVWHVSPPPTLAHHLIAAWLHDLLAATRPPGIAILQGAGLALAEDRYLIPDLCAVRTADLAGDGYLRPAAVLLAVEIVSPSSRVMDRVTKPALYAEAGIACYWRVESDRAVHGFRLLENGTYRQEWLVSPGQTQVVERPWKMELR